MVLKAIIGSLFYGRTTHKDKDSNTIRLGIVQILQVILFVPTYPSTLYERNNLFLHINILKV